MLYQLSYAHRDWKRRSIVRPALPDFVRQEGLEPPSIGLEGRCSIHLSYCPVAREPYITCHVGMRQEKCDLVALVGGARLRRQRV